MKMLETGGTETMCLSRVCKKCGQEKPVGEFRTRRLSCKACEKEYQREWHEANREKVLEQQRKWREDNPEKMLEQSRKYREANREKMRERKRKWYEANREKELERHREYREANREKRCEQQRKYREANPEKVRESDRKYKEANPEKRRESERKYRALKFGHVIKSEGVHWTDLLERDGGRCWLCKKMIPKKYRDGRAKYDSSDPWAPTVDHIKPISEGGPDTFSNSVLAHRGCNARKGNRKLAQQFPLFAK